MTRRISAEARCCAGCRCATPLWAIFAARRRFTPAALAKLGATREPSLNALIELISFKFARVRAAQRLGDTIEEIRAKWHDPIQRHQRHHTDARFFAIGAKRLGEIADAVPWNAIDQAECGQF